MLIDSTYSAGDLPYIQFNLQIFGISTGNFYRIDFWYFL
uniref:Uncharacterized protein n=1 Tax=Manihot esculenta TaxID=3983 RepID=A0A2C9VNV1_MANES